MAVSKFHARVSAIGHRATRALPSWAKPSRITAYTGVAIGLMQLLFIPLNTGTAVGDSWLSRLKSGWTYYQESKNPFDILAFDSDNNNALSIAALQLQQNALPAVTTIAGFGIAAAIEAWFGM